MFEKWHGRDSLVKNNLCIVFSGVFLGWLMGLSVAPVVKDVITSLMLIITTFLTILSGIKNIDDKIPSSKYLSLVKSLSIVPVLSLMLGVAVGATSGVYVRAHNYLGPSPQFYIDQWSGSGIDKNEIAQKIFDSNYSLASVSSDIPNAQISSVRGSNLSVLFSANADICQRMLVAKEYEMKRYILLADIPGIEAFVDEVDDPAVFKSIAKNIMCNKG